MANNDEAGARAAAEYFVELYGYAVQSQDLVDFITACDPESTFCTSVLDDVGRAVESGHTTVGGETRLSIESVEAPGEHPFFIVRGQVDQGALEVRDSAMQLISESPAETGVEFVVAVEFQPPDNWVVRAAESGTSS